MKPFFWHSQQKNFWQWNFAILYSFHTSSTPSYVHTHTHTPQCSKAYPSNIITFVFNLNDTAHTHTHTHTLLNPKSHNRMKIVQCLSLSLSLSLVLSIQIPPYVLHTLDVLTFTRRQLEWNWWFSIKLSFARKTLSDILSQDSHHPQLIAQSTFFRWL